MKLLLTLFAVAAISAVFVNAQSISVGNGNVIYQVLFSKWQNPAGKLFTGSSCNYIAKTCQTRFNGYVEIVPSVADKSSTPTWPGPKKQDAWPVIGESYYKANDMTDFAYLNLTGVELSKFKAANLRVKVSDSGYVKTNEINSYYGQLPALADIGVTRYESDAKFSPPIELDALSTVLPSAVAKGLKADRTTVQQQHLFVKVRAWGAELKKSVPGRRGSLNEAEVNDSTKSNGPCNKRCRKAQRKNQARGGGSSDGDN